MKSGAPFCLALVVTITLTGLSRAAGPRVYGDHVDAHWFSEDARFWYRNELPDGKRQFILVDVEKGTRQPAFDHARAAEALSRLGGKHLDPDTLPVDRLQFADSRKSVRLFGASGAWDLN